MAKRDFNFKLFFENFLKITGLEEITKTISDFKYQIETSYAQKNNYERIHAINSLLLNPMLDFYSELKKHTDSKNVPNEFLTFEHFNFSNKKIKNYLDDKNITNQSKKLYYIWFTFVCKIFIQCYDLFEFTEKKRNKIKSVLSDFKSYFEYKFGELLIVQETETIKDEEKTTFENENKIEIIVKGISRDKGDGKTILSVDDTVLLFKFLIENKIFLEADQNCNYTNLAKVLSVLTGYSQNSLRQCFGMKLTPENTKKISEILQKMIEKIEKSAKKN